MKNLQQILNKFFVIAGLLLLLSSGCKKEFEYEDYKENQLLGVPNAVVTDLRYISHNGQDAYYEMDVAIFGAFESEVTVNDSAFKSIAWETGSIEVEKITRSMATGPSAYSLYLMLDVSGSRDEYDPFNLQTRMFNHFFWKLDQDPEAKAAVGFYSRNGELNEEKVGQLWTLRPDSSDTPYDGDIDFLREQVFWSHYWQGGTAPIYEAIQEALTTAAMAPKGNQEIFLFAHNADDTLGNISPDTLIELALAQNSSINILFMDNNYRHELGQIALKTGGFISVIESGSVASYMDKGSTVIANLHQLLKGTHSVYTLHLHVKTEIGAWNSGGWLKFYINVKEHDENGQVKINNLLPFYGEIP